MAAVHPVLGALAVVLFFRIAMLGFRARHDRPYAADARRQHRHLAQWTFWLVLGAMASGAASTSWLRHDLEPTESSHFSASLVMVALALGLAWSSRRIQASPAARRWHPVVGVVALAAGPFLGALGFNLLP